MTHEEDQPEAAPSDRAASETARPASSAVTEGACAPDAPVSSVRLPRSFVVAVVLAIIVLFGLCGTVLYLGVPLLRKSSTVSPEWKARLTKDYPGWKTVGFNVRSSRGTGGSWTAYDVVMVPSERDFAVGVVYLSENGGKPESQDYILRDDAEFYYRADSLLNYINATYIAEGLTVASVISESDGSATVNWQRVIRFGPVWYRNGSSDALEWNEANGTWRDESLARDQSVEPMVSATTEDLTDSTYSLLFDKGMEGLEAKYGTPTASFTVAVDPEGSIHDWWEMPNGRAYHYVWGVDATGTARVLGHTVEVVGDQSLDDRDRYFVNHFQDGVTPLSELNAYFAREGDSWKPLDPGADEFRTRVQVPAYLWRLSNGSGFIVRDFRQLSVEQRSSVGMDADDAPYDTWGWEADHRQDRL
jgi:hypothetical protein